MPKSQACLRGLRARMGDPSSERAGDRKQVIPLFPVLCNLSPSPYGPYVNRSATLVTLVAPPAVTVTSTTPLPAGLVAVHWLV